MRTAASLTATGRMKRLSYMTITTSPASSLCCAMERAKFCAPAAAKLSSPVHGGGEPRSGGGGCPDLPEQPMHLARFPRVKLAHLPTPLEPMARLSEHLGATVNLWIKRDDCTGLSTGGNKTRKLEFLMGEAVKLGADTVITQGATQSNHARQ